MTQTLTAQGERDYIRFAKSLAKKIDAPHFMIGKPGLTDEQYQAARHEADEAARLVKHIVQNVANRHIAVVIAVNSGCPAYINYRRM